VVFGPQTLHRLPELLARRRETGRPQVDISFPEIEKFDHLPPARVEGASAFVSIMEGCSKYCTFCVVPYTRGEEVSRPFDDILAEVRHLAAHGVKEVTLLGQNVNAYRGELPGGDSADFALLPRARVADRGHRAHPLHHVPSARVQPAPHRRARQAREARPSGAPAGQSGSDRVLAAMKRGYTAVEYKSIIRRLRAAAPTSRSPAISSSASPAKPTPISSARWPRRDVRFDGSFSFIYSARPGTPAANLADETREDEKLARLQRLQARLQEHSQEQIAGHGSERASAVSCRRGPRKKGPARAGRPAPRTTAS
jgi:tRNA-2-methylthio-N6-dimethylallyladenosine synthase